VGFVEPELLEQIDQAVFDRTLGGLLICPLLGSTRRHYSPPSNERVRKNGHGFSQIDADPLGHGRRHKCDDEVRAPRLLIDFWNEGASPDDWSLASR